MHKLQRKLQTDHLHLLRLLKCLSHEIDCYDFDSQRSADLAVILSRSEGSPGEAAPDRAPASQRTRRFARGCFGFASA